MAAETLSTGARDGLISVGEQALTLSSKPVPPGTSQMKPVRHSGPWCQQGRTPFPRGACAPVCKGHCWTR